MNLEAGQALEGFMVIPAGNGPYRGVDRNPFEPELPETPSMAGERISDFYPAGWTQSLYRLAEDNCIGEHGFLFSDLSIAVRIQRELLARVGPHDVVAARVTSVGNAEESEGGADYEFLGHDIAYLGGDFYSAVRNGLFVNADPNLVAKFSGALNGFGLFPNKPAALAYFDEFIRTSVTEPASLFHIYALWLVVPHSPATTHATLEGRR